MSSFAGHGGGAAFRPDSLVDALRWRAEHQSDRRAYTFLVDGDTTEAHLTYADLDRRARAIGAHLQALGAVGERVMLVCPPGLEYVSAYWGCLYAGAVAVPSYPPRANRTTDTLLAIVRDSGARVALATAQTRADVERDFARASGLPSVQIVATEGLTDDAAGAWRHPGARLDTLAFLQFTSGSTGMPKGVMVSHGNLIANMTAAWGAVHMTPESVPFSWLPPFHDMGLISGVIHPVFAGLTGLLMAPAAFIQRPVRWLRAVSRYRVTHSGGPPFAYEYCLRKIAPDQLDGVDLSTWETAYVGAEPIRVETLERFAATYAPHGLRSSALMPCYGMAEATLMVSGGPRVDRPVAFVADAAALEANRVLAPGAGGARALAGCGQTLEDTSVVIANPETLRRCAPGEVGEIWVSAPGVAHGYWNKSAESEQTFRARLADSSEGPFLRTGDLGFVNGGQIFVTGRHKDLIILKGKNHYPQDIEHTVEHCHPALRPSGVAAFSIDQVDGEQLVVVQEVEAEHVRTLDADAVIRVIRQAVAEEHDVTPAAVVLLRPGTIPKTSSGKIRRRATREGFLTGTLPIVATWTRPGFDPHVRAPALTPQPPPLRGANIGCADVPTVGEGETDGLLPSPLRGRGAGGEGLPGAGGGAAPSAEEIQRWLIAQLAEVLQVEARTIDVREPFARYGLTSVEAVGLSGDLEQWLGRRLSPTLAYDFPSIEALARRLSSDQRDESSDLSRQTDPNEPIAIVGIGCRLPGANNPDDLWRLLRDGVDATGDVPADRWPVDDLFDADPDAPGKIATRRGGFLDRVDGFDADFFRIAAREAIRMDPQQRLLLEVSWEALEDAGQAVDRLAGTKTGVFMGICSADYARLHLTSGDASEIDAYSGTGVAFSIAIGRISYVLGLQGPNMAVDTSCSSSLVAIHLACQSLRSGECELALAGGVNMMLAPETSIFLSKARALAPDGRCKTFDAAADGYARGEGCGVVVLKRLSDALADGDRVLALIRGSAVNHDGHSNGLTAPNGPSQEAVIRDALTRAGVGPGEVGYVEAHGTGTALGDPIEVQSLAAVLGVGRSADRPFALGSIKTNIGHLEAAAGVAGLLKVVLGLQRGMIPPHLNLNQPSPYIPWSELPIVLPTTLSPWPDGNGRRIAGVSAFGFSGTNAHVVLEEAPAFRPAVREHAPTDSDLFLLPISARSPAALRALAEAYRNLLGPAGTAATLPDICYTAGARRSHHAYRVAIVGRSREELVDALDAFLRDAAHPGLHVRGRNAQRLTVDGDVKTGAMNSSAMNSGAMNCAPTACGPVGAQFIALPSIADAYVHGDTPDWQSLYPDGGRCVSLPLYPWQRERFWITDGRTRRVDDRGRADRGRDESRPYQNGHAAVGAQFIAPPPSAPTPSAPTPLASTLPAPALPASTSPAPTPPAFTPTNATAPAPDSARAARLTAYLASLIAKAVDRPASWIEPERPLTDLGLDSLMAMDLRNRIDADLGIVVPLTTFLQGPSIADLVAELAAAETQDRAEPLAPSPTSVTSTDGDLPLSHGQQALWLTHQLAPKSTAYHIMFAARLLGGVDAAAMASAVHLLVDRHDSLRTTYLTGRDGRPIQRVQTQIAACFEVVEAGGWSDQGLHARLGTDADRPFNLEHGPLFRVTLFRRSDAEHVLLLTVHHLAVDFWSLEVLVEELRALYDAARTGQTANLPVTRQYVDFVRWQADMLAGPAGDRLWSYWQTKLAGDLPLLAFPTDRPRPRVQTYRGALCDFTLDEQLTARLKDLARSEGATPYATLLAAFAALLARYTSQDDLLIGTPMAGRGRADFEHTVGYLVNVLPLRADLSGEPTFRELLRRMRDTVLEALDHQDFPFSRLVERLQTTRDPGRSPLVEMLFIWYRSALLEASTESGAETSVLAWEQRGAPYDVMLLMTEARATFLGRFQYNADLFEAETMARLAEHFRRLLESVVADPDRPVSRARMLTAAERVQQLVSWNDTTAAFPADACLHDLFEAQMARTPDATALIWDAERISYRELNRRANRLARELRTRGVGPEMLVGLCTDRTPAMVVGLLAVLKSGGAYVPLDPAYPEARLAFMLRDSRAAVLLTERKLVSSFADYGADVVCLDDPMFLTPTVADDDEQPATGVTPRNLAYVIYTSGSTGQPKGVAIEHRGPVALAAWARDQFDPASLRGVLASTSICFDLSVFELFAPLTTGGTVILAENVLELPRLPAAEEVTLVNTVPSGMAELLRAGPLSSSVRVVNLAGEVLPNALAQELYRQEGVQQVYNLYGPTEDTTYSTWALVERGASEPSPIGRPIANKRVYLLDGHLQPVPVGVPGEVYTAGVGVARGYLHRPDLTAERFVASPFGDEPDERLYRVGDLARYRPDGSIELLGRVDHQVKVRGFRIELGEIEAVLGRHPAVRESVVVARDDQHGQKHLVAYLVGNEQPADGQPVPTVSELRRFLQHTLPDYMVPASIVWLDALPRTPNGKLDRQALPDPGSERPDLDVAYVAPRTPTEALLAEIWADVLQVDRVGIYDSFFDLGGASFASVAIAARASDAGLPLTADLLFAYPTIADLSDLAAQMDALTPQPAVAAGGQN